jgi:predicted DNA-binding protein
VCEFLVTTQINSKEKIMNGYKEIRIVLMDSAHERLKEKAEKEGRSLKQAIMELIGMYIEEEGQVGLTDEDILLYCDNLTKKEVNDLLFTIDCNLLARFGPREGDPI